MILVDYGNVLFDIDFSLTIEALKALDGYNNTHIAFGVEDQDNLFVQFDKGEIPPHEFRSRLRSRFGFTCSDNDLDAAWCAILKAPYPHWMFAITELKEKYPNEQFVLLSNISVLHYQYIQHHFRSDFIELRKMFDRQYFSFQMGLRKPDAEAFLHVCEREGVTPADCIFYDDSQANCEAAKGLGMQVAQVTPGDPRLSFLVLERA